MSATMQLLKEMGPAKLMLMAVVGIFVFVAMIFLSLRLSDPAVVPLFSSLDPEDSAKIATRLETMGIHYVIDNGGAQIMVPSDKVLSARMTMAEEGLPSAGATVGYEIFDKADALGVPSFVHNVNLVRALEGELARTISSFSHVSVARVHLVLPKRNLFSRMQEEPSASVVLRLRGNRSLEKNQISAISHLVATAVPGLPVGRITIVDTQGRPFKKGAGEMGDPGSAASTSEEHRLQYERKLKHVIEELLSRSVGRGKVEAQVSAEMDFDRIVTDSEVFDPEGQVARSVQTISETEQSTDGNGNVTVANNLPGNQANAGGGEASNAERVNEITNFEVSKTISKHVRETGAVKRLSIAVLVDGTYNFNEETEEYDYVPREENELSQLEALVKTAVGFDEERGDSVKLVNMKFSNEIQGVEEEKPFDWITRELSSIVQMLIIGVVITLLILLVVKPIVSKAFEIGHVDNYEQELNAALEDQDLAELSSITGQQEGGEPEESDSLIDIDQVEEKMKSSSLNAINDIIDRHPNESVTILRGWMEGGQNNG